MPVSTQHIVDRKIESSLDLLPSPDNKKYLNEVNDYLFTLDPKQILEWAVDHLPNLYQTTAFGLSGLVALDMVNKISVDRDEPHRVPLIFLDTLYHFDETLELAKRCKETYGVDLKTYKPMDVSTTAKFEETHGQKLWETDEDGYDYLIKVEPARRAYKELNVKSIITGRRRSQKGERSQIPVIEVDSTGLIKLNPLALWDFERKSSSNNNERSGRWSGKDKSECGLHKDYFQMRTAFIVSKKKREHLARESSDSLSQTSISF
ncbi:MAG: phosphoadenosine phosphosulfate reductase [Benjaminiella poitrasii]|nr:MAG: phosphoadenosine phosphosulfate reductase [Benjaminiella poitrasii]